MKVVVAHNQYSSAQPSGENSVVAAEIEQLARAGVEVIPFLRSSDELPHLPAAQRIALPVSPLYARTAQRDLRALIVRDRPDVLHLHNPYPLLSPWVVRTAHEHGVPVVHTLHNFRQTCVNGLHIRDGAACHDCTARTFPSPAVRHRCYRGSRAQSAVMATALTLHRGTWATLDRLLVLSPAMESYARSLGIAADRVVVRPNAVPDPGPATRSGDGFLFAGRLSAEKGVDVLLDAWARHPDGSLGRLRVAGDGPLRALVEERAAGRSDIDYLGRLDAPGMAEALRGCATLVVPSVWDEVCPVVVLEALAHARPVLASNRGGLPWLIGAAGWTVDPTPAALADALPMARAEGAGLTATARDTYLARFTPQVATAVLLDVYRSLAP